MTTPRLVPTVSRCLFRQVQLLGISKFVQFCIPHRFVIEGNTNFGISYLRKMPTQPPLFFVLYFILSVSITSWKGTQDYEAQGGSGIWWWHRGWRLRQEPRVRGRRWSSQKEDAPSSKSIAQLKFLNFRFSSHYKFTYFFSLFAIKECSKVSQESLPWRRGGGRWRWWRQSSSVQKS